MVNNAEYKVIINKLFTPETVDYVKEGMAYSLPICGMIDSKKVDCFFLYALEDDRTKAIAPTAILKLYFHDDRLAFFETKNDADTIDIIQSLSIDEIKELRLRYSNLYPEVRAFAFNKSITAEQQKTLADYVNTLKSFTNDPFYEVYQTVSPEFFEWVTDVM